MSMRTELWQVANVNPNGTIGDPPAPASGAMNVHPGFWTSREQYVSTPSLEDSGDWLSVSTGRLPDGTVTGITLYFDSREEMNQYIRECGIE